MKQPRLLVFASGNKDGGGSGFENLVESVTRGVLKAHIVGVVSNHSSGGVMTRAKRLGVPFYYFCKPWSVSGYQWIFGHTKADFAALSGWLKIVKGLDPRKTFNIHPGPLPRFGGKDMYGHHVHEAVIAAYRRGEVTHSAVTMHFVTGEYDKGPIFFEKTVQILPDDTAESLGRRVNEAEHEWQPILTNAVLSGKIGWDGYYRDSLFSHATIG